MYKLFIRDNSLHLVDGKKWTFKYYPVSVKFDRQGYLMNCDQIVINRYSTS